MKLVSVALAFVLAAVATAQTDINPPGLPSCASGCVSGFEGCGPLDAECICSNTDLLTTLSCCVFQECEEEDQEATIQFAQSLCEGYGVTNIPDQATCVSSAASATSSATDSSTGTATTTTSADDDDATDSASTSTDADDADTTVLSGGRGGGRILTSSSSQAAEATDAATHESVGKFGLGMIAAGLVAAL